MLYLSKILPLFVLPTGITLLLVGAGLILRRAALCWAGFLVLAFSGMPYVSGKAMRAAEGWQVRQAASDAPVAQAIVVLSHGRVRAPGASGMSEWVDADRFYGGVDLYRAGKAPLLIFTGGSVAGETGPETEGDVLIRYASDLGVPRERMLTTAKVFNTEQESREVARLLSSRGLRAPTVLLVTSAFHMRRARMLFAHAGVEAIPFPVDFRIPDSNSLSVLNLIPNVQSLGQSETALRELYGIAFHKLFSG